MLAKRVKTVTAWINLGVGTAVGSIVGGYGFAGVGMGLGVLMVGLALVLHQHDGVWRTVEGSIAHE